MTRIADHVPSCRLPYEGMFNTLFKMRLPATWVPSASCDRVRGIHGVRTLHDPCVASDFLHETGPLKILQLPTWFAGSPGINDAMKSFCIFLLLLAAAFLVLTALPEIVGVVFGLIIGLFGLVVGLVFTLGSTLVGFIFGGLGTLISISVGLVALVLPIAILALPFILIALFIGALTSRKAPTP